jgi:hypothetical protein
MKVWLKTALCAGTMLAGACVCGASFAQTYTNSRQRAKRRELAKLGEQPAELAEQSQ